MLSIPTLATAAATVTVVPQALLVVKGAGAAVTVEVTCDLAAPSFLLGSVFVHQRVGNGIASGSSYVNDVPINCDGTLQKVEILVLAQSKAFGKGSAIVGLNVYVCSNFYYPCNNTLANQEIQLVNK